jgi:hypothetical protein
VRRQSSHGGGAQERERPASQAASQGPSSP